MRSLPLLVLASALAGCDGPASPSLPPPPPPLPPTLPAAIQIVSGSGWTDSTGDFLAEPFVVRVVDGQGQGMLGMKVSWGVLGPAGQFGIGPNRYDLFRSWTATDLNGVTAVHFRPVAPGVSRVWAAVSGLPPVYFNGHAAGTAAVLIRAEPLFDCNGGNDPTRFNDPVGVLPVGATVTWEYASWLDSSCHTVLRGTAFEFGFISSELHPGSSFSLILHLPGDWTYEDVHGGKGMLQVR